jgi:hypothetical protein
MEIIKYFFPLHFIQLLFILSLQESILSQTRLPSNCSTVLNCQHSGVFNTSTCKCNCIVNKNGLYYGIYFKFLLLCKKYKNIKENMNLKGDHCEYANCSLQSSRCDSQSISQFCNRLSVRNICPQVCNKNLCKCSFDTCFNNGTFDSNNCSCSCQPGNKFYLLS